jgi:bifunctional DNA-binding transcriptional regulator/antitoxin component of YhaV-PrlF toxin-antitoxin module
MMVMSMTSKITSGGKATLPKETRDKVGGNAVRVRKAEPFDLAWHWAI